MSAGCRLQTHDDIGLLWIGPIEPTKTHRVCYGVQGFEHPVLFHVGKRGANLVQSLARSTSISIVIDLLVTWGNAFIPLMDLFFPPGTILNICSYALSHMLQLCEPPHYLSLRCQVMIPCPAIRPPHLLSDLHLLHQQQYPHLLALGLLRVMRTENVPTHWNCCLLKALEIQLESQHETCHCQSLTVMILSCWSLMHSLTWNWSLRKMSWNWTFVNVKTEKEISSDYIRLEKELHMLLENEMCACYWRMSHACYWRMRCTLASGRTITRTNLSCLYTNSGYICHGQQPCWLNCLRFICCTMGILNNLFT